MEDRNAISRLKRGDLDALEGLVRRYQARAVHAAYLILHDRASAEDVVQSAFVKVAQRIDQFDEARDFAPWFYRIVVNDALKLAGKRKRLVSLDEQTDESVSRLAAWLTDPTPHLEQVIEQDETRALILKAIRSLPPEQRAVIVMRYYLDMRMADMSAQMHRPLSTIKWWLRDAHARLRNIVKSS